MHQITLNTSKDLIDIYQKNEEKEKFGGTKIMPSNINARNKGSFSTREQELRSSEEAR
jgi:hypothetical protein